VQTKSLLDNVSPIIAIRHVVVSVPSDAVTQGEGYQMLRSIDWRVAMSQVRSALFDWEYNHTL
jgi:hypothetical protein